MTLELRTKLFLYRTGEVGISALNALLPREIRNRITLHRLGQLTASAESLHKIPVTEVTIDEIIGAMKEEESVR